MRLGRCRSTGKHICHWFDAVSRSHKLACRSPFRSEMLAACATADGLQARVLTLRVMVRGHASAEEE
eukprot:6258737-Pyramimonas_sp.AAC.1